MLLKKKLFILLVVAYISFLLTAQVAQATPRYARETGESCLQCHEGPGGRGLTASGELFQAQLKQGDSKWVYWARLLAGFIHLLAAVIWIGAIFFIHFILSPQSVRMRIPRAEIRLAWTCIFLLAVTGSFLTLVKGSKWVFATWDGQLLLIKIGLFLLMVSLAAAVTFNLNRCLKVQEGVRPSLSRGREIKTKYNPDQVNLITAEQLAENNGQNGKPVWVAAMGKVYDFTNCSTWLRGSHALLHEAGRDLTRELLESPHEAALVDKFPVVGVTAGYSRTSEASGERPVKVFYFLAYFNLSLAVLIILLTVLIRWS